VMTDQCCCKWGRARGVTVGDDDDPVELLTKRCVGCTLPGHGGADGDWCCASHSAAIGADLEPLP
jgi:hypothetical protein